jgi:GT2 family glycosyltransferase
MKPLISVIYVYYNTPLEMRKSLKTLFQTAHNISYEVIIINNASTKILPEQIRNNNKIKIIDNKENLGFGKALNQGVLLSKGEYLLFMNPDAFFTENAISSMIGRMKKDTRIGMLGPQLINIDTTIQMVGNDYPLLPHVFFAFSFLDKLFPKNPFSKQYYLLDFDRRTEKEIPVICGACMLTRKNIFEKIGGFDEQFFMYFEESDICIRIKREGLKVIFFPKAKIIHIGGKSSYDKKWIQKTFEKSRFLFFKKYHHPLIAFFGEAILRVMSVL